MKYDLKTPQKSDYFYDIKAHKEFCDLCDKNNVATDERLTYAEKMGVGFAYKYMCEVEKAINAYEVRYILEKADGKNRRFDIRLDEASRMVFEQVGDQMTPYIVQREGKIDCWPSPVYPDAFNVYLVSKHHSKYYDSFEEEWIVKDTEEVSGTITMPFNYFGGEYIQKMSTSVSTAGSDKYTNIEKVNTTVSIEQRSGLHYRETHHVPTGIKEYEELAEKKYSLERQYEIAEQKKSKNNINIFKKTIILAPTIVTLIIAILAVYWSFTGTANLEEAINKGFILQRINRAFENGGILKIIAFIPAFFIKIAAVCWYIPALIGYLFGLEKIVVIMCMILLVVGGIFMSEIINENINAKTGEIITGKEWKSALKAKKEAERIASTPKYKELEKDYYGLMDEYRELSQKWQKAWFKVCMNKK